MEEANKRKLLMAAALCAMAILAAVYAGIRALAPPKAEYPAGFSVYGPSGPPSARSRPPGSTPGGR